LHRRTAKHADKVGGLAAGQMDRQADTQASKLSIWQVGWFEGGQADKRIDETFTALNIQMFQV